MVSSSCGQYRDGIHGIYRKENEIKKTNELEMCLTPLSLRQYSSDKGQ